MELEVIVAVEDVVFAIVLIVDRDLDLRQPAAKRGTSINAMFLPGVGVAAPVDVGFRQVGVIAPVAFVDERKQAGTIATGLGAEDPVAGPRGRVTAILAIVRECPGQVGEVMLADEVLFGRLRRQR